MTPGGRSFGGAAQLYDTVRPTYPLAAITWALAAHPLRVLDLGAGTGLLTRALLEAGHRVVCVEPDVQMSAVLAARLPDLPVLSGGAEEIPLPDGCVDAVMCGQAYHWFEPARALPEIRRVLRPGGVFAPIWNIRDERVAWVAEFSRIVGSTPDDLVRGWAFGAVRPWFTEPEGTVFEHRTTMDADGLLGLLRSRSYYLTATATQQVEVEGRVRRLLSTDPELAGRETFDLRYRTCVFRMRPA